MFQSCHPKHTKLNIPYNLARRLCTIISDKIIKERRLRELKRILLQRKYPEAVIDFGIQKAASKNIQELRQAKTRNNDNDVIAYVSTYNPRNTEVFNIIYQNLPMLNKDERMKKVLQQYNIIKSKRQPKSLKKLLTSAKFETNKEEITVKKCRRSNCGICVNIMESSIFTFKSGEIFKIKSSFSCASGNLLYIVTCKGCGENYIGQTGTSLRTRFTVHRQQIRDPSTRQISLSEHLDTCANRNYSIFPFYQFPEGTTEPERINKETFFIKSIDRNLIDNAAIR